MTSRVKTERSMGLLGGMSLVLGCIIGSGIFISPKGVIEGSGSVGLSMVVWLLGGALSMFSALSYVEMGTMVPRSGGEYAYLLHSSYPVFAFLYSYVSPFVQKPGSISILTLTCAKYLLVPLYSDRCGSPPELQVKLLAISLTLILGFVNCKSGATSNKVMIALTLGKFMALALIIIAGMFKLMQGSTKYLESGFEGTNTNAGEIAIGFYSCMWAFEGWNLLNQSFEELKNPMRNLPLVIYIGLPLVTVLYLLTNISYLTVMSPADIVEAPAVAITWADRVVPTFSWLIPICVAMSTFGSAYSILFSSGRIIYSASREKHMIKALSMLDVQKCVPTPAIIVTTCIACAMVIPSTVGSLLEFMGFITWTTFVFIFGCLLCLRHKQPNAYRPYQVPLVFPVLAILISSFIVLAPIIQAPQIEFIYAIMFVLSGLLFYIPFVAMSKEIPGMGTITIWLQLLLQVCPPDSTPDYCAISKHEKTVFK